jgi:NO-binding membrane sensor protein with MHYT domain
LGLFYSIYFCIAHQHNIVLVAVAALICLFTATGAMTMLRQARMKRSARLAMAAGGAAGFGVWCTHFVAMLGYLPGSVAAYHAWPTLSSLVLAVVALGAGLRWPIIARWHHQWGAAVITGAALPPCITSAHPRSSAFQD